MPELLANYLNKQEINMLIAASLMFAIALYLLPPVFVFSLFLALGLILISVKKVEIGVFLTTAYIPFEPFLLKFASDEIYPYLRYATEGFILILFLIIFINHFLIKRKKRIKTPIDIALVFFIFFAAVSTLVNFENPAFLFLGLRQLFRYTMLYYIIIYSGLSKKAAKRLVILLISLLIIQAGIGIAQAAIGAPADHLLLPGEKRGYANIVSPGYVAHIWSAGQRVFATMGRYDRLGTFMCLIMLLTSGFYYQSRNKKIKNWLLAIIIFSIPTLIFSYSRMSWLGFALGIVFIGIFMKKDKKLIIATVLLAVSLLSYLGWQLANNNLYVHGITENSQTTYAKRFLALFSLSELKISYNDYGRLYFIVNTPAKVVANYPLFGVGLGHYGSGVAAVLKNTEKYDELGLAFGAEDLYGQIDNNWFSIWGETGTLGFIAFIFIILNLYRYNVKIYKNSNDNFTTGLSLGFMAGILAVSLQAFLGPYFEIRSLSYNFWLLSGLTVNLGIKENIKLIK